MNTNIRILFIDWDSHNAMHMRTLDYCRQLDYDGSFKQFMVRKTSKQYANDQTIKYLLHAQKELQKEDIFFNVIGYSFSDGKIFLKIESDEKFIGNFISFLANTGNNFLDYSGVKEIKFEPIDLHYKDKELQSNGSFI